jgi:hypothetical protein
VAKLDAYEKGVIASALWAMLSECPPEEAGDVGPIIASISHKLGLEETFKGLAEEMERARAQSEPAK